MAYLENQYKKYLKLPIDSLVDLGFCAPNDLFFSGDGELQTKDSCIYFFFEDFCNYYNENLDFRDFINKLQ